MRWWLPLHDFTIDSPYPPGTAQKLVKDQVGDGRWFSVDNRPYKGKVGPREFRIERLIRYQNSFRPVVTGRLEAHGEGSRVHVAMRLHPIIMIVLPVFMVVFPLLFAKHNPTQAVGILLAFVVVTLVGFWYEASYQESMLRRIFAGREP
jgi:hypothetical protein